MIRSSLGALGLAALAIPAVAACPNIPPVHTRDAVIYAGDPPTVQEVIVPTDDCELDDPAFHPAGAIHVQVTHGGDPIAAARAKVPTLLGPVEAAAALHAHAVAAASTSLAACAATGTCAPSTAPSLSKAVIP